MKLLSKILCSWFYSGFFPVASGTAGTIAAMPFAYLIHLYFGGYGLLLASFIAFLIGVPLSNIYMKEYEREHDPKEIVIDEVSGIWLLIALMDIIFSLGITPLNYIIAFTLFRIFDAAKPYPISWVDKNIKGGFGVMIDDILAAIYPLPLIWIIYEYII